MKFKVDENLSAAVADDLRAAGHEADTVADEGMAGAIDAALLAAMRHEGRVLFTLDKGIADVRAYPPDQFAGIVLFRPGATGRRATLEFVRRCLPGLLQVVTPGHLYVVSESGIRVR